MARFEYHPLRATAARWTEVNPILSLSEFGHEKDTGQIKLGDGFTAWNDLPYVGEGLGGGGGDVTDQELLDHVNSLTPHPIYDDGPSLTLLYENAKV